MKGINLSMQNELWIKGNYAYLVVIEVEPNIIQDKERLERVTLKFSNIDCHKVFIPIGGYEHFKEQIEYYLIKHNIDLDDTMLWRGGSKDLLVKLIEKKYGMHFKVDVKSSISEGLIKAVTICNLENVQYAFYINCEGKNLYRSNYEEENFIEYHTNKVEDISDKNYQIVHFIKLEYGRLSIVEKLEFENKEDITHYYKRSVKKKIFIHGSCVSRDILNFGNVDSFKLVGYAARQSLFAVKSSSVLIPSSFENKLTSNFQKRMLNEDFEKHLFTNMSQVKDAYLIIDLIDTIRFPLYKYQDSIVTGSTECNESGILDLYDFKRVAVGQIREEWDVLIKEYTKEVKKYFAEEKIIIHCAYFKYVYTTINGGLKLFSFDDISKYKMMNKHLQYLYNRLKEQLPDACYIDQCKGLLVMADEKHHFGLSPVHYSEKYYLKVKKEIEEIK